MVADRTLLCLAHLHWDHVWQRPQQVMTRLTQQYRVIYVDPPELVDDIDQPEMVDRGVDQGVHLLRPRFPGREAATQYRQMWQELFATLLQQVGPSTVLWVYSPYADYLVAQARPHVQLVVYDCMDDLASFKDGTLEMREREAYLLTLVDLVFTGGHSMYQARKDKHPHVHAFPSGVDLAHYQQTQHAKPPQGLPATALHPQLGYFGVLDERIDWPLIAGIAARRPDWHWVLVGPTAKVDPEELPKADNIHYLGKQSYGDLPGFLQGFDVATMPFALNEATKFISPTKTLEYLAGGKPVISSSVADVVAFYRDIVTIVDGVDSWISAIEAMLQAQPGELEARHERAQPVLAANTWDAIAARMAALIDAQIV